MNDVEAIKDPIEDPRDDRIMRGLKSQITFFVLKEDGRFDVVAIQTDHKPGTLFRSKLLFLLSFLNKVLTSLGQKYDVISVGTRINRI